MDNNSASEQHITDQPQHLEQGMRKVEAVANEASTTGQASALPTPYPGALLGDSQLSRRVNWPVNQASILQLQMSIGYRATQRFLQRSIRQISSPSPARMTSESNTIQRLAKTLTVPQLSEPKGERWRKASMLLTDQVLVNFPLAKGKKNQVVLYRDYANCTDQQLEELVNSLGLDVKQTASVLDKLEADRNIYNTKTGQMRFTKIRSPKRKRETEEIEKAEKAKETEEAEVTNLKKEAKITGTINERAEGSSSDSTGSEHVAEKEIAAPKGHGKGRSKRKREINTV